MVKFRDRYVHSSKTLHPNTSICSSFLLVHNLPVMVRATLIFDTVTSFLQQAEDRVSAVPASRVKNLSKLLTPKTQAKLVINDPFLLAHRL